MIWSFDLYRKPGPVRGRQNGPSAGIESIPRARARGISSATQTFRITFRSSLVHFARDSTGGLTLLLYGKCARDTSRISRNL
jgi:hypothetical protein